MNPTSPHQPLREGEVADIKMNCRRVLPLPRRIYIVDVVLFSRRASSFGVPLRGGDFPGGSCRACYCLYIHIYTSSGKLRCSARRGPRAFLPITRNWRKYFVCISLFCVLYICIQRSLIFHGRHSILLHRCITDGGVRRERITYARALKALYKPLDFFCARVMRLMLVRFDGSLNDAVIFSFLLLQPLRLEKFLHKEIRALLVCQA